MKLNLSKITLKAATDSFIINVSGNPAEGKSIALRRYQAVLKHCYEQGMYSLLTYRALLSASARASI